MSIEKMYVALDVYGKKYPKEIEVLATFSEPVFGQEFTFCIHDGANLANAYVISHYESGLRVAQVAAHDLETADQLVERSRQIVRDIAERLTPEKMNLELSQARPIFNGPTQCPGTGEAGETKS